MGPGGARRKRTLAAPILVTGGTGHLGRAVVSRLRQDGRSVRVLSRHGPPPALEPDTEWCQGDLLSGAGLDAAVAGTGAVIHCATSARLKDVEATLRLVEVARHGGEPHVVYISIVGIDNGFAPYRMKVRCEHVVADSGLPWTTLRATQFHYLVAGMFRAQRRLPVLLLPKGVRFQPVDVRDVADRLGQLAQGTPAGRVADLGGPEVAPVEELAQAYLHTVAQARRIVPVPVPGRVGRQLRAGSNLTPEHAEGRMTFAQYLREQPWAR